ncbi:beta-phosphoglucomutase [Deinococcus roseus]|uniref:Beta-phosphoglucomutase n=1 Tax=Deinococcus roseus TaxID=392414 RepID=A0ABQ2CY17_9DEIO|nr:beta-phosphoglucomutase [Deinococcus roseus]GGJ30749.1 beta-phosphoglucomutase [Deinococcus roseus]
MTFKAVIFDLDGVITDTAHYHYLAWKRLAEQVGVPFDEVFNERLKGVDRMGSLNLILSQGRFDLTEEEKVALATQKNTHYQELIAEMTPEDLLPGAVQALDEVRQAGLKIGLASVSRNAFTVLSSLGITEKFDYIVDASTIARGKPDPEIFLKAAAELGVTPEECLGVEDAVAGVASIKSAGMYAVGVGDPQVLTQADRVIPGLQDFSIADFLD